jgi:hypothetical protein
MPLIKKRISVRDEDVDWIIYHRIPEGSGITIAELAAGTGFAEDAVRASVERLCGYKLVRESAGTVHVMSIQESLIACQCQYESNSPIYVEDGVIKVNKVKKDRK